MKKTYIAPELLVVRLTQMAVLASSPDVGIDSDDSVDAGAVEVRSVISNKSVWDEEW